MINFSQLFTCKQTQIYSFSLQTSQKKYLQTSTLSVLINENNQILLMLGQLCYGITKQTKIQYFLFQNNHGHFAIIKFINKIHGNYQILVKENVQLLLATLNQKFQLINKANQNLINKQKPIKQDKQTPKQLNKNNIGIQNEQNNKYVKMSQSLAKGIFMTGRLISQGITKVGGFIANNVQPSRQIKLSQNTKNNLRNLNQWSTQAFQFTSGSIKKLINYGHQIALQSANQNAALKMIQQTRILRDLKNGAITGIKVVVNIYDGIVQGGDQIKNGAFLGGQEIIKKKYGVQAEQALKHVAGGVGNVIKIYKLPKNTVKYIFKLEKQDKQFK